MKAVRQEQSGCWCCTQCATSAAAAASALAAASAFCFWSASICRIPVLYCTGKPAVANWQGGRARESAGWLAARCGASGAPLSALELYAHSRGRMRTFSRMYSVDPKACGSRSWLSCSGATGAEGGAGGAGTVGGASAVGVVGAVGAAGVDVRQVQHV
eukprot:scaffold76744_cov67-Phaeocystis_antarctica.AAC.16